jgi:hypothetical protein
MAIEVLSDLDLQEENIALDKLQTIGSQRILGNPSSAGSDNVGQLDVRGGLRLKTSPNRIELTSINQPTGTLQFVGVVAPATNTIIFVDGIADERMEIPNDTLRLIKWNAFLFNDSTDELLADTVGSIAGASQVQYLKIYPNGWDIGFSGTAYLNFNDVWNLVANTNPIVPQWRYNGSDLHQWEIYIDYTGGFNNMTFDVRLIVDVEYYDYPI